MRWAYDNAPDKSPHAPLVQNKNGSPFSYTQLQAAVKSVAHAAGLNPDSFSSHSCRIGGATSLALMGCPAAVIKKIGRWKSACYQLYVKPSNNQLQQASRALGAAASTKAQWFGSMSLERACVVGWEDFSDTGAFPGHFDGGLACQWHFSGIH